MRTTTTVYMAFSIGVRFHLFSKSHAVQRIEVLKPEAPGAITGASKTMSYCYSLVFTSVQYGWAFLYPYRSL